MLVRKREVVSGDYEPRPSALMLLMTNFCYRQILIKDKFFIVQNCEGWEGKASKMPTGKKQLWIRGFILGKDGGVRDGGAAAQASDMGCEHRTGTGACRSTIIGH
jgi:hypothetical protein